MGQRLIIENYIDNNLVNNIYYHWSAYTKPAIEEVINVRDVVVNYFDQYVDQYDESLSLTDNFNLACLSAVSGITERDTKSRFYLSALLGETYHCDSINRNRGLIAYHPDDRYDLAFYGEGTIAIFWEITDDNQLDFQASTFCFDSLTFFIHIDQLLNDINDEDSDECDYIVDLINDVVGLENKDLTLEDKIKFIEEHHSITDEQRLDNADDLLETLPSIWYDPHLNGLRYQIM